ncbi:MAG: hypothetical protein AB7K68_04275 [Bacteriovoracia bacterium]
METLSFTESLHSRSNRLFLQLRTALKFRRSGYRESGSEDLALSPEAGVLESRYGMGEFFTKLHSNNYLKNLSTLSWLENLQPFLGELPEQMEILETGAHDFSRLPAIRNFFTLNNFSPAITGLELDPFPILTDLHSRADKADYYISLTKNPGDKFLAGDFFKSALQADCILSFYPFVSANPALAWGLPAEFGSAEKWLEGFSRTLKPGGLLLVVHQGEWEEKEFDEARKNFPLELLARTEANSAILTLPHPPCLSVYRRTRIPENLSS